MGFKCGIVGLPNVGKSTLFNALVSSRQAVSANYPFCTIDPNVGVVHVPDERLTKLANIAASGEIIPTHISFVDIAGLIGGASKGEGLGNKFLSNIREVDLVIHLVRCFENGDVVHVYGGTDPMRDIEVINTELALSDLESVERRIASLSKRAKTKEELDTLEFLKDVYEVLSQGESASTLSDKYGSTLLKSQLITAKPVLYVCNVDENSFPAGNEFSAKVMEKFGNICVLISAQIEEEIALMEEADRIEFLVNIGVMESGLSRIIRRGYEMLGLKSYFTIGPKEARAWTFGDGMRAPQAAGIIHTDFERGFIKAEVISYNDYVLYNGEQGAKAVGKMRLEGKDYVMQDGDVVHFRFNT